MSKKLIFVIIFGFLLFEFSPNCFKGMMHRGRVGKDSGYRYRGRIMSEHRVRSLKDKTNLSYFNKNNDMYNHGNSQWRKRNCYDWYELISAVKWGLIGGIELGMRDYTLMFSDRYKKEKIIDLNNIIIINNYNKFKKDNEKYKKGLEVIEDQIVEIDNVSDKLKKEFNSSDNFSFIKKYFDPFKKIAILSTGSDNVYGDGGKDMIEVPIFKGDQLIEKEILKIQKKVKNAFDDIYKNMNCSNKNEILSLKQKLIESLKKMNKQLLNIVRKLI